MKEEKIMGFIEGFLVPLVLSVPFIADMAKDYSSELRARNAKQGKVQILEDYVPVPIPQPAPKPKPTPEVIPEFEKKKEIYVTRDFSKDSDLELIGRVIFGEARGRNVPYDEKVAVGYSVLTRRDDDLPYNGEGSIRNVVFYPNGYSCFSNGKKNEDNLEAVKNPVKHDSKNWETALKIADGVLSGKLKNPVPGANLYDLKGCNPKWLKSPNVKRLLTPRNFRHIWCRERRR